MEQIRHDEYPNAIFASAILQEGSPSEWKTFYIVVPNVLRLTEQRQISIASALWNFTGRLPEQFAAAPADQKLRWARMHMGRYRYVEIFTYDDGTWGYRSDSSGGGDFPNEQLKVMKVEEL